MHIICSLVSQLDEKLAEALTVATPTSNEIRLLLKELKVQAKKLDRKPRKVKPYDGPVKFNLGK